jgi:hypothetical protein
MFSPSTAISMAKVQGHRRKVPEIVKFWKGLSLSAPPFVHPQDLPALKTRAADLLEEPPTNLRRFIASRRFDPEDRDFHFSLLPSPYVGDVCRADILLLLLNPGFKPADYYAEWNVPEFRDRVVRNLYQRFEGVEFPFLLLDPQFCWHRISLVGGQATQARDHSGKKKIWRLLP